MIFSNTQPAVPEEMLNSLLTTFKEQQHDRRMEERGKLLDRYTGKDVTGPWKKMFTEKTKEQVILAEHKILKGAIDKVSMVYKKQPKYDMGEFELPDEYSLDQRWLDFKKAERLTNLLGTLLIHPVWRAGRLQRDIIWEYWILTPHDPLIPSGILYPVIHPSADVTKTKGDLLVYWDSERHFLVAEGGNKLPPSEDNQEMVNPYGVLPFMSCHAEEQSGEYWVEPPFSDVSNVMDEINMGLTEGRLALTFNTMGQPVISGDVAGEKDVELGVDKIMNLRNQGDRFEFVSPTANFPGLVEMLKFEMITALNNHGISPKWSQEASTPPSGWSLMVQNLDLLENREDDVPYWIYYDNGVYEIERRILEVEANKKLPEERLVNFTEVKFPLSPEEDRSNKDWRLKHGLDSIVDYIMQENPGGFADRDKAIAKMLENKTENRRIGIRADDDIREAPNLFERRQTERTT